MMFDCIIVFFSSIISFLLLFVSSELHYIATTVRYLSVNVPRLFVHYKFVQQGNDNDFQYLKDFYSHTECVCMFLRVGVCFATRTGAWLRVCVAMCVCSYVCMRLSV